MYFMRLKVLGSAEGGPMPGFWPARNSIEHICPVSPFSSSDVRPFPPAQEGWENPAEAGVALDGEAAAVVDDVDGVEEVSTETGQAVQLPRALPSPTLPSKKEVEFHNLTHIPYRSWCPFCVAARRKNSAHKSSNGARRTVPLFCADYCLRLSACWLGESHLGKPQWQCLVIVRDTMNVSFTSCAVFSSLRVAVTWSTSQTRSAR